MNEIKCEICAKFFKKQSMTSGELVADYLMGIIHKDFPKFDSQSFICPNDLNLYRSHYVQEVMRKDFGEINDLEREVLHSLKEHELITENTAHQFDQSTGIAERLADQVATFGGSWKFIILFGATIFIWIIINSIFLAQKSFDPYPYILLNLVLSCIAALQAPVIMMSQNRQEAKDRLRAEMDYKINLKAELEIRHLKLKLDQLSSHQWRRLLEIQELQTQLIKELADKSKGD
jgi:uncharacterized membrane protein